MYVFCLLNLHEIEFHVFLVVVKADLQTGFKDGGQNTF